MTRDEVKENLLVALDTIRNRKMRSALTILGIVIGVTSVITVAAIIDGLNAHVKGRIQTLGSRALIITRIPPGFTGGRLPANIRTRKYLRFDDAQYLKETVPALEWATAFANRINFGEVVDSMRYGNEHVERLFIRGVEPQYTFAQPLFAVAQGRFVSQYDLEHARNVVVIGNAIADSLFPHADPIGKTVRMNGREYEVIGVFEHDPGLFSGFGVDQFACIPLTNFHKNNPEVKEVFLQVSVQEGADMAVARNQVIEALRRERHVKHNAENDFDVSDADFFNNLWDQLTGAMALLTGVISSIGLLVGGIGVMNIMLISVTERTAEIGIRKAIGARKSDIRLQFLLEAITLSGIGGALGIMLGGLIALLVRAVIPSIPAAVSIFWVFMGVSISVTVGLFFGYYPANRAANLDPIVCLRYE
ncbi:MAG TPA: ABC transporter permease [Candidatus Sulfopaludibacter sp.]|jgi:putative ABC transport system permease protein|nr:ABC transporter permease [Candidatus Sulfopaludibacter sp.]